MNLHIAITHRDQLLVPRQASPLFMISQLLFVVLFSGIEYSNEDETSIANRIKSSGNLLALISNQALLYSN
jgi:hypothetical protein